MEVRDSPSPDRSRDTEDRLPKPLLSSHRLERAQGFGFMPGMIVNRIAACQNKSPQIH